MLLNLQNLLYIQYSCFSAFNFLSKQVPADRSKYVQYVLVGGHIFLMKRNVIRIMLAGVAKKM
jgi:hypothetical protein